MKAVGQHVNIESLKVRGSLYTPHGTDAKPVIDVLAEDLPSKVVNRDGSTVSVSSGQKLTFRTTLSWSSSGWKVIDSKLVQG